jgi:hypothetical protein
VITLKSTCSDQTVTVAFHPASGRANDRVSLHLNDDVIDVMPAKLIAALETECGVRLVPGDAIVTPRAHLPVVRDGQVTDPDGHSFSNMLDETPDPLREWAYCYLALAEHLDLNPPVEEVRVKALLAASAPAAKYGNDSSAERWARKAVTAGWVDGGVK